MIYQTILNEKWANCMQTAFASLFEISIYDTPHFKAIWHYGDKQWFEHMVNFVTKMGYDFNGKIVNPNLHKEKETKYNFEDIRNMDGVDGYFYAVVYSPILYKANDKKHPTHAVIIDKDFNIVNPINKNYTNIKQFPKHEKIGYNGIVYIYIINKK